MWSVKPIIISAVCVLGSYLISILMKSFYSLPTYMGFSFVFIVCAISVFSPLVRSGRFREMTSYSMWMSFAFCVGFFAVKFGKF